MYKVFVVLSMLFLLLAPSGQHANSQTSTDARFGDGAIILLPIEEYEDFDYDTQTGHLIYGPEISSDGRFATAISVVYGNDESSVTSYLWELDLEAFAGDVIQVRPSQVEADSIGSFSPDAVYWLTYNVSTLNFMRLTDFETVRSIPLNNNHDTLHLYAYWSPDSRYVGIVEAWENYFTVFDLETDMSETRDYYGSFGVIPLDTSWLLLGASDSGLKGVFEFCTMLLDSCATYGSEDANGVVATPDGAITYVYTRNSSSELSITQWQRQADNTYELVSSGEVVDYQPILRNISPNGEYVSTDSTIYRTGDWQSVGSPDFNHKYSLDSHYVIRYGRHNSLDLYRIEPFTQLDSISLAEQLETAVPSIDIEYTRLVGFSPDGKWVLLQLGTFAAMIPIELDSETE